MASAHAFDDVDIERLRPLGSDHIALTGRYGITLPEPLRDKQLRPGPEHDPPDDHRLRAARCRSDLRSCLAGYAAS
jgi:hypothetical protein